MKNNGDNNAERCKPDADKPADRFPDSLRVIAERKPPCNANVPQAVAEMDRRRYNTHDIKNQKRQTAENSQNKIGINRYIVYKSVYSRAEDMHKQKNKNDKAGNSLEIIHVIAAGIVNLKVRLTRPDYPHPVSRVKKNWKRDKENLREPDNRHVHNPARALIPRRLAHQDMRVFIDVKHEKRANRQ